MLRNCVTLFILYLKVSVYYIFIQDFIRSADFDKLMNDPLRTCVSYPLKVKTAALLLVLRMILWDRWDCLIPLTELWQTAKQIATLTSTKNHDWAATFRQVTSDNLKEHVPSEYRDKFVTQFIPDLVSGADTNWKQSVDTLIDTWSTTLANPAMDYPSIFEWLIDPENERRRQAQLSDNLWRQFVRGFGQSGPSESIDLFLSDDEEDDDGAAE